MELYIDNQKVDTYAGSRVSISLSVVAITDPKKGRVGYTKTIKLPMTALNDSVFKFAGEIHAKDRFNETLHSGRVEHEGAALIEGPIYLNRVHKNDNSRSGLAGSTSAAGASPYESVGFYEVYIIGAAKEWVAKVSAKRLGSTQIAYSRSVTGPNILASWTDSSPVKFLPVARETTPKDLSSGHIIPRMKVLSSDDYHPFIHAGTLLKQIFAENGYSVVSNFVNGLQFNNLYISGMYPTREVGALKANMDFLARRLWNGSATANYMGRVYANPYTSTNSVGNVVDTAQPEETGGLNTHKDVFTNNGCFQMDDKRVAFIPTGEVSVGFQYHLCYSSQFRMKNRSELTGFNKIYLGDNSSVREFTIANPYTDRRAAMRPLHSYNLIVFDFFASYKYQFLYTVRQANGSSVTYIVPVTSRVTAISTPAGASIGNAVVQYRSGAMFSWQSYISDWAVYDGYISETGSIDLEVTMRTAPETVSPGKPKFFDGIFFEGAESGMKLTISDKSWVRPVFYAQPTEGVTLQFADVCAHAVSQMDFINAIRQMFNLCFLTDNSRKTITIEPYSTFYSNSADIVDYTDRVDLGRPVTVEELGSDISRRMAWSYRTGDGAVARQNRTDVNAAQAGYTESGKGGFGYWEAEVKNSAATDQTSTWENHMFTPSISAQGVYLGAPSARLVQAGDSSATTLDRTEDLNFEAKIVRYEGVATLPSTERWGWPRAAANYPKIAFHAPESGYTLCFEDRDGCAGLGSTFWEGNVRLWNESRRVTVYLHLSAADVEAVDFRALYRISLEGEECYYRLEEICDYDPEGLSTKCVFIKYLP